MGQLLLNLNPYIEDLDILANMIDGILQENLANMISNVGYLNLSKNGFEGIMPSSIVDLKYLKALDLSSNNFSGKVSKKLFEGNYLEILILSDNKFEGEIFSTNFTHGNWISRFYLNNNHFNGILSNRITEFFFNLRELDVSNNNMSGEIPSGIGNMTYLDTLILAHNGFKGKLPPEIAHLQDLAFLDVSHNAFSGHLPSLNTLEHLKHLHLQGNMFEGSIPNDFLNSSFLLTLDIRYNKLSGNIPSSISTLSDLRILLLNGNHLSGFIPNQLCQLRNISLMDLSNNNFYGSIPSCFGYIHFGDMKAGSDVFKPFFSNIQEEAQYVYEGNITKFVPLMETSHIEVDEVEFVTKYNSYSYRGGILDSMSGLDLSCNNLTGEIPHELGLLNGIHVLNLSHNQLKGSIPKSFINLSQIESLDLSYNQLSGEIPLELIGLYSLSVFSVAHNNISGSVPDKAQFSTFDESSYEGNPFLCGQRLKRKCNTNMMQPSYSPPKTSRESEEKWHDIDRIIFFASFGTSYITILSAFVLILYVNPCWRRRWFNLIEEYLYAYYYFVCDTHSKVLSCVYN